MGRRTTEVLDFQRKLGFGQSAENEIAKWLISKGYSILPVYETEGDDHKGPRLFSASRQHIAPDILALKGGWIMWVEAKHKTVFTWYRIKQQWETGIDIVQYDHYLNIAKLFPHPLWLMFLHKCAETHEGDGHSPTGLYGGEIKHLSACESHRSPNWGRGGMVYWAESDLKKLADLATVAQKPFLFR